MGAIGRASSALTFLWSSAQAHPKKAAFGAGLILPLAFAPFSATGILYRLRRFSGAVGAC